MMLLVCDTCRLQCRQMVLRHCHFSMPNRDEAAVVRESSVCKSEREEEDRFEEIHPDEDYVHVKLIDVDHVNTHH